MTDFYSTMAPFECITCSENDFNNFKCVLMTEKKRLEKDELWFCLDAEYHAGELFIFNEYYFDRCLIPKDSFLKKPLHKELLPSGQCIDKAR